MVWEQPEPDLHRFYTSRYVEDERLRRSPHGRLEFARTQELLRRALPPVPARVLDVGGGTGIHAEWLAEDGYEVVLLDVVPEHVEHAAKLPGVAAFVGDARALAQPAETFDAVLLLGPLYHLTAAAAISRYAGLLDLGAHGLLDDLSLPIVRRAMETGEHDPRLGFTTAYFHTPQELAGELEACGLTSVEVFGVEGPAGPALDAHGIERIDEFLPSAIEAARVVERDVALIAASAHLLAFGRRAGIAPARRHERT